MAKYSTGNTMDFENKPNSECHSRNKKKQISRDERKKRKIKLSMWTNCPLHIAKMRDIFLHFRDICHSVCFYHRWLLHGNQFLFRPVMHLITPVLPYIRFFLLQIYLPSKQSVWIKFYLHIHTMAISVAEICRNFNGILTVNTCSRSMDGYI